jgi:hypothetical protein
MLFTTCYVCIVLKRGPLCVLCFCFSSPFGHQELEVWFWTYPPTSSLLAALPQCPTVCYVCIVLKRGLFVSCASAVPAPLGTKNLRSPLHEAGFGPMHRPGLCSLVCLVLCGRFRAMSKSPTCCCYSACILLMLFLHCMPQSALLTQTLPAAASLYYTLRAHACCTRRTRACFTCHAHVGCALPCALTSGRCCSQHTSSPLALICVSHRCSDEVLCLSVQLDCVMTSPPYPWTDPTHKDLLLSEIGLVCTAVQQCCRNHTVPHHPQLPC